MNSTSETPVVFIHGLLGTLQDPAIREAFGARAVVAPDLLGYGHLSGVSPPTITIRRQVEHIYNAIAESFCSRPVHLVGHSVGGVIACLFAHQYPDLVASIVSVEGNFTLRDAFWSASVARMGLPEVELMLNGWRADPGVWLARAGIQSNAQYVAIARVWLSQQPASTIQATARSVVETTGVPEYLAALRTVFATFPVHLVAGERSRDGWDTPEWALADAASFTLVPHVGHLMMIEDAANFGRVINDLLRSPVI